MFHVSRLGLITQALHSLLRSAPLSPGGELLLPASSAPDAQTEASGL